MWKCTYIETSAKKNYNIEAIFQEILTLEQKRQLELKVEGALFIRNVIPSQNRGPKENALLTYGLSGLYHKFSQ